MTEENQIKMQEKEATTTANKQKIFVSLRMTDEFRPLCQSKIYPQGNFHTRKKQDFFPP